MLRHFPVAGVAQLVEHLICNQRVRGSNPFASSRVEAYSEREPAVEVEILSDAKELASALMV